MSVNATTLAQAVVDALNDAANDTKFSEEFTAKRVYTVSDDWEDYKTDDPPSVFVLPNKEQNESEGRPEDRFNFTIGIVIIRKVESTDINTIDPLLALPRSIREFLNHRELIVDVFNSNTTLMDLYGHDELHQDNCLVSTIRGDYWTDQ